MKSANLSFLYAGASISLMIRLCGAGLLFAANIVLARSISQQEYGLFAYAIELIALMTVIVALGFDQLAIRVVPDCLAQDNLRRLRAYLGSGFVIVVLCSAAATGALGALRRVGALSGDMSAGLLLLVGLSLAALASLRLAQETMRASRRIALSQLCEQIGWPLVLLAIGVVAWMGVGVTVSDILMVQVVFLAASAVALVMLVAPGARTRPAPEQEEGPRQWLVMGVPLALAASLSILLNRGDILALGSAVATAELAPYAAASRYAALLVLGQAAASAAGATLMRDAWRSGDRRELQHAIDLSAGLSALFALPIGAFLLMAPDFALALYGPGYVDGAAALRVLTLAQLVNSLTGPVALVVIVCDLGKIYTVAMAASTLLLVILLAWLVPAYGLLGAATSTLLALSALNMSLAILIRRRIGLRAWATPASTMIAARNAARLVLRR